MAPPGAKGLGGVCAAPPLVVTPGPAALRALIL